MHAFSSRRRSRRWAGVIFASALLMRAAAADTEPGLPEGLYAVFDTARGRITAELFFEATPLTVCNFVGLAEGTLTVEGRPRGRRFYDGLVFHRVIPGFVAQGGCPLGTGEGDAGWRFADEFSPRLKHDAAGVLAMANSGPGTNSCQFYFTFAAVNRLNYKHTVFGRLFGGLEVLEEIRKGDAIERVEIVRVGARAGAFRPDDALFAKLREDTPGIAPRDPELPPLFANPAGVELPDWAPAWIGEKLHHYSVVTGRTVWVRTAHRLGDAPAGDGQAAATALAALHRDLAGDDPHAATLVLTTGDNRWHLALGPGLLAGLGFAGPDGTVDEAGRTRLASWQAGVLDMAEAELGAGAMRRSIDAAVTSLVEALDRASARP
jgi:cyclophilin family peptidyl-prolyl cis-trans isomerase